MICIVDYGVGNLASIKNMLRRIEADVLISSKEEDLNAAEKLILPGVGAFDTCAGKLRESGLMTIISKRVIEDKVPVLGICVGMQLLLEGSEEGNLPGLSWIRGRNIKFRHEMLPQNHKVPHMGWTDVKVKSGSRLFNNIVEPRFYFVHSYHAQIKDSADVSLTADYGYEFVAGVEHQNILGVQFHPEKSHQFGMQLFRNFLNNY